MSTTNNDRTVNEHAPLTVHSSYDLFGHFQATTRAVFEAQQAVLERYLAIQERLLGYCMQDAPAEERAVPPLKHVSVSPVPAAPLLAPVPAAEADPAFLGVPASSPVSRMASAPSNGRPPIPVNGPAASPRRTSSTPIPPEVRPLAPSSVHASNGSTVPNSSPDSEEPPSTDAFRRDLLEVVSMRTGYPIDALDENLALEAALGIDSIKTVEIFSKLKAYHPYFRAEGQEEEELLAEFSKFKTLRDIIASYDHRRKTHAANRNNGASKRSIERVNEPQKTNGDVQRYTVAAVPAPSETNGSKKNPLMAASSS